MDFLGLAREARTCRRFDENAPLKQADLEWLLDCARVSSSARNAQQLRFITVGYGDVCKNLFGLCHFAGALKDWDGPVEGERPTAFIDVLMPAGAGVTVCFDVGICCQTMQLAAASRGWGACMIHSFDRQKTAGLLNTPTGFESALLMAFGVAVEKRMLEPMPKDGSFSYWRDENQVHHVPKRSLEELIVGRF